MAAAQAHADAALRRAHAAAAAAAADGTARARAIVEQAVEEGRRAAERAVEHRLVDGRRCARGLILRAQRAAYERLVREAIRAAEDLRRHPEYADLERRLIETAKALLGPDATIIRNPDEHGGVRASVGGRTVDLTLAALARRCVDHLGEDVTCLWT